VTDYIILSTLWIWEKITGIVEKDALVNELETKHKIPRVKLNAWLGSCSGRNIYEPRKDA
jgi:hypothetical protein